MDAYFEYLRAMIVRFFSDFARWHVKVWAEPWADVPGNFEAYGSILAQHSADFGFWGWFLFVLFAILFVGLIGGICFGLFLLLRKYVRFLRKEFKKDEMEKELERLNYELYIAVQEKDKILNLKSGYLGLFPKEGQEGEGEVAGEIAIGDTRFPKLAKVDADYAGVDTSLSFVEGLSLEVLCNSFRNFAASKLGLYYTIDTVRQLFAGLGTTKLIILEGISGTGKTSLAYALGQFFSFKSEIIAVQPSWKDRSELLGYYNEFTKKFNESEFLRALYVTTYRNDLDIIVLDEMNLARIEYYFAEFLSVMEMRDTDDWVVDIIPTTQEGDPIHIKNGKLHIPQNVFFFGTANNDDSTFTIADKVYDRAISIFFDDKGRFFESVPTDPIVVPYNQLAALYAEAKKQFPISEAMMNKFNDLDNFVIKHFKLAFGNRILKQLEFFIPNYVACGGTESDGFDFIFANKVLKKFEGINIAYYKEDLKQLDTYLDKQFGKGNFKMSHNVVENLLKNA